MDAESKRRGKSKLKRDELVLTGRAVAIAAAIGPPMRPAALLALPNGSAQLWGATPAKPAQHLKLVCRHGVALEVLGQELGFVVATVAGAIFLHEHVSSLRWAGVILSMIGAALIGTSGQAKPTGGATPQAVSQSQHK